MGLSEAELVAGARVFRAPVRCYAQCIDSLPAPVTSLIGRSTEVAAVVDMVTGRDSRIVTLTGPGGTGKTRVGLQAATELASRFEHGVGFVNLAPLGDADLVVLTMAVSLGVKEVVGEPILDTLTTTLRDKRMLLLLDNFEHVHAAAPALSRIASAAPDVHMLVTSRVPLRLRGEREYPVSPLTQPEAVRLFADRAAAIDPDFQVTNDNQAAVAEICARLDGLPLAIELAAARIRVLSVPAMLARLQNRLTLLTGGAVDADARQRTLRAAIDWSHELLDDGQQRLFRKLAVFSGGCTLSAIEAVCVEPDPLDGVDSLVHNNLLRHDDSRFRMLETIGEFANEKLTVSGALDDLRRAHAEYFLEVAEHADLDPSGRELVQLRQEYDNLRAALEWAYESAERTALGARLTAALWRFWYIRGYWSEAAEWLMQALSASPGDASLLFAAGQFAVERGDYVTGRDYFERSVRAYDAAGDAVRSAFALGKVGDAAYALGDYEHAQPLLAEALARTRALGNKVNVARLLSNLGELKRAQSNFAAARELNEESLAILATVDHAGLSGDIITRNNLGKTVHREGDCERALELFTEALTMAERQGNTNSDVPMSLLGFAGVAATLGTPRRAARLFGAAENLLAALGATLWPADRNDYERDLASARAQLDETAFEAERAEGRAMTSAAAIDFALNRA